MRGMIMSRQDNSGKGKTSGRGGDNSRNRSSARGNAPLRSEAPKKKNRKTAGSGGKIIVKIN